MHLYVMARGINDSLKRWEDDISATYMPIKYTDRNGKVQGGKVRTAMRPIQLYEIVFPEESLNTILETVQEQGEQPKYFSKFAAILRRVMGLKKAERRKHNGIVHAPYVAVAYIGTKKDLRDKNGCELL